MDAALMNINISGEEVNKMPLLHFNNEIIVVDSRQKLISSVKFLKKQPLLGFDTETRPSFKKGIIHKVALLQLSSSEHAFVFRINKIGFPPELAEILSDPGIIKAGVDIRQDLAALQKIRKFNPRSFVDIQKFSGRYGITDNSLRKITAIVLGFRISKSQRLTNWDAPFLTKKQLIYAATDAWACYCIYNKLLESGNNGI